jgi:hypothetical protein
LSGTLCFFKETQRKCECCGVAVLLFKSVCAH